MPPIDTISRLCVNNRNHYNDVIMGAIASQITSLTIVYSIVYSDADQRKHQSSTSLAFVRGIHLGPLNSPHKWPVTRKMFPFDDVIMYQFHLYSIHGRNYCLLAVEHLQMQFYINAVTTWKHFPRYHPFVKGVTSPVKSSYKGPITPIKCSCFL